jgi:hypothetical protein
MKCISKGLAETKEKPSIAIKPIIIQLNLMLRDCLEIFVHYYGSKK